LIVAKRFSYASLKGSGLALILDFLPAKVLGLPMIRVRQPVGLPKVPNVETSAVLEARSKVQTGYTAAHRR
jgi:hypothetical protein